MNKFNLLIATLFLIFINNVSAAVNNWNDFSNAPIEDSPWKGTSENFYEGYKMAKEAQRMQAEQRQLELQNKILEEQLNMMKKSNR